LKQTAQVIVPHLCHLCVQRFSHFWTIHQFEDFAQKKVTSGDFVMFCAIMSRSIINLKKLDHSKEKKAFGSLHYEHRWLSASLLRRSSSWRCLAEPYYGPLVTLLLATLDLAVAELYIGLVIDIPNIDLVVSSLSSLQITPDTMK
jgi:hypothetical protein